MPVNAANMALHTNSAYTPMKPLQEEAKQSQRGIHIVTRNKGRPRIHPSPSCCCAAAVAAA
eukprot:695-Heterococcus_DN1.PRE.2